MTILLGNKTNLVLFVGVILFHCASHVDVLIYSFLQVIFDESLHHMLDSFLQYSPR